MRLDLSHAHVPVPLFGVDFTSRPGAAKPITVAHGRHRGQSLVITHLETCAGWPAFEALLARPGPWVGAFDFPFGLPREAVAALGWPLGWAELVDHCARIGRDGFTAASDALRISRPPGSRYPHRSTDLYAGSSSPMKCVNPPVGWMFVEGAPRLLRSGVTLPGLHPGDPDRVALEAYPGFLARRITSASYKADARSRQTPVRRRARERIVRALLDDELALGARLDADPATLASLIDDPRGDLLDAALALAQAAWCARRAASGFGLPAAIDPIEGWIATVPLPGETACVLANNRRH